MRLEPILPWDPDCAACFGGREAKFPDLRGAGVRHKAADLFMMSVEEKEDAVAFSRTATLVIFIQHAARKAHAEAADEAAVPIGLGHLAALDIPPEHVLLETRAEGLAGEEVFAAENRIFGAERDQLSNEFVEFDSGGVGPTPVEPCEDIVLAVAVVVSLLGMPTLVACEEHGHALRQKERG